MSFPTLSLYTSRAREERATGFSMYFPPAISVRPMQIQLPVYVQGRQMDVMAFTLAYEQTKFGFGKSKAIVHIQNGPLSGQRLEFHPNKDNEKNITTCCDLIEGRLKEWQDRQRHLASQIENAPELIERGSIDGSLIKSENIFFDAMQALLKKGGMGSCETLQILRGAINLHTFYAM